MIAVAMTMLVTVLPSAATMPMASTNSGNAMIVSATPAHHLIDPAAEEAGGDAGDAAHGEHQRDRKDRDRHVEPGRDDRRG